MNANRDLAEADKQIQIYYDQSDTNNFYHKVVIGGEHVHIGLFKQVN
ncbi:MAG: hypothetical protein V7K71_13210 [Nostoc sp.]